MTLSEYYQCIVQALYNLVYVQAVSVMSCKFTEEERSAWREKSKEVSFFFLFQVKNTLDCAISESI